MPSAKLHRSNQARLPATYMRGGSSKAVFFHEHDIPPPGKLRDRVLKRVMGTPDPLQIDGMGGAKVVTTKIAIIGPSIQPDADINYTFAQVGVDEDSIGYDGNCGNISSGVGPFAIEEGLIKTFRKGNSIDPRQPTQEVRIYQTGTKKILVTHVPVDEDGNVVVDGDFSIAAVPGTGAPILMDFRNTIGAAKNSGILPTGYAVNTVTLTDRGPVDFTICDVANIIVFVRARDLGIEGLSSYNASTSDPSTLTAKGLTSNTALLATIRELRGKAAQMIGMCTDWKEIDTQSPYLPMLAIVDSAPAPTSDTHSNISARLFLDNMCHESMAGTGACCLAAAASTAGTIVNQIAAPTGFLDQKMLQIAHPTGVMPVSVEVEDIFAHIPTFKTLSFVRTARRIMDGFVYVPKSTVEGEEKEGE